MRLDFHWLKTDWNFAYSGSPFDSDRWSDLKTHQPFYAQLNFQETHRKFHAPKRADPGKVKLPLWTPDHPVARADWAEYLDAATELDRKIGLVLKLLENDGLAGNTVLVFFGDNGEAHVRGKQFCYDSGLHVPLIIRWPSKIALPRNFKPGAVEDRLLASIDLAPTMLSFAGAFKPAKMEGEIFLGDRAGKPRPYVFGARDRCDETVFRLRTVRETANLVVTVAYSRPGICVDTHVHLDLESLGLCPHSEPGGYRAGAAPEDAAALLAGGQPTSGHVGTDDMPSGAAPLRGMPGRAMMRADRCARAKARAARCHIRVTVR